jgi:predicted esterase
VILNNLGADVQAIDDALTALFERLAVNPRRVAVGGFSDGASYALTLGMLNGTLFRNLLAFSPGFSAATHVQDRPRVFVSHGMHDQVLPIDPCSRRLVPKLRAAGLDVQYREFDGGHTIPPAIASEAVSWLLSGAP